MDKLVNYGLETSLLFLAPHNFFLAFGFVECPTQRSFRGLSIAANPFISLISPQSINLGGRRGTTDDVVTITLHLSLSSAALRKSPKSIPVHSLIYIPISSSASSPPCSIYKAAIMACKPEKTKYILRCIWRRPELYRLDLGRA